jgi:hypothetical protein
MDTVEKILNLFDDLDGYESVELIDALAERGYELKINIELERQKRKIINGIFLKSYNEDCLIPTIKLIRNAGPENQNNCLGFLNLGLREAKNFVENDYYYNKYPFIWGSSLQMKSLCERLNNENSSYDIVFFTKEININNLPTKTDVNHFLDKNELKNNINNSDSIDKVEERVIKKMVKANEYIQGHKTKSYKKSNISTADVMTKNSKVVL